MSLYADSIEAKCIEYITDSESEILFYFEQLVNEEENVVLNEKKVDIKARY